MFKKFSILSIAITLVCAFTFSQPTSVDDQTAIQIEALNRLKGIDLESNPTLQGAVLRVLEKTRGTPQFVDLVRDFQLKGQADALLEYALKYPDDPSGVEAFRLALAELGKSKIDPLLNSTNGPTAIRLIGNTGDKDLLPVLQNSIQNDKLSPPARKEAVRALTHSQDGARFLLDLAREDKLPTDLKFTASSELNLAPWPEIKKSALELLPLLQSQNAEPLPPLAELLKRTGDPARGQKIFESQTAACSSCHQVNGKGTDVGPKLSEIGTKLGKDALYESILDPSAGISFGYEAWSIETKDGDEAFGMITSETNDEIAIKNQTGLVTKIKKDQIATRQKASLSMMPTGLQLTMSTQDLVDLVEYLSSLKKQATLP